MKTRDARRGGDGNVSRGLQPRRSRLTWARLDRRFLPGVVGVENWPFRPLPCGTEGAGTAEFSGVASYRSLGEGDDSWVRMSSLVRSGPIDAGDAAASGL